MADTIAGTGHIYSGLFRDRTQIVMVIRCLEINIKKVMIKIRYRCFYLCRDAQLLKSKIGHNGIDIMCQRLIDLDKYIFSRLHRASDHM